MTRQPCAFELASFSQERPRRAVALNSVRTPCSRDHGVRSTHTRQTGQIVGAFEQLLPRIQSDLIEAQKEDARNVFKKSASLKTRGIQLQTSLDKLISEKANTNAAPMSNKETAVPVTGDENQCLMVLRCGTIATQGCTTTVNLNVDVYTPVHRTQTYEIMERVAS